jgi:D-lactate dehydrogenase
MGGELAPEWAAEMPPAAPALPLTERGGAAAVYFPACINRIFGPQEPSQRPLPEVIVELSARAGMPVWIPPGVSGHCCAVPWSSKGHPEAHAWMANHTVEGLWSWTEEGELPVVVDASSCTEGLVDGVVKGLSEENAERHSQLSFVDSIVWSRRLLPTLELTDRVGSMAVHPTCSVRQLGLAGELAALAAELAEEVQVPPSATCCGFAGDRGFLHPELAEAATADEAAELAGRDFDAYVSSNRTCEVGLSRATGRPYGSVAYVLEQLSRPDRNYDRGGAPSTPG